MHHYLLFISTLIIAYLIPGPDMLVVINTTLSKGRVYGLATTGGLALARTFHVVLASLGLSAILKTSPVAFQMLHYLGGAYLIWLGYSLFKSHHLQSTISLSDEKNGLISGDLKQTWVKGLLTNLLNPKALLFCAFILPKFIQTDVSEIWMEHLLLGIILVGIGFIFDVGFMSISAAFYRAFQKPHFQKLQKIVFGFLLIGSGIGFLVMETGPLV